MLHQKDVYGILLLPSLWKGFLTWEKKSCWVGKHFWTIRLLLSHSLPLDMEAANTPKITVSLQ